MKKRKNNSGNGIMLWGLFLEKILEKVNGLVMIVDANGNIIFANKKCLKFFSFLKRKIIGKHWIDGIVPEYARKTVAMAFKNVKRKKSLGQIETPVSPRETQENKICWTGIPLANGWSDFFMFIGWGGKCPWEPDARLHHATGSELNIAYRNVVETIFNASKESEPDTAEHSIRVVSFATVLARKLKISKKRIEKLKIASLLHDLGKLAIDEKIIYKKGKLTKKEFDQVKKHPYWSAEMVRLIYFLHDIIPILANHHENYDGSGYPQGLKGEDIPLESRILSVADIYEALTADRPYRKGFSRKEAIAIMEEEKGHKLDPKITDVFLKMVRREKL